MRMLPQAFAATLLLAATLAQAQLTDTEQRIAAAVRARAPAALDLLEKAVRINSGTLNPEGVRAVGEIFRAELEGLGFRTRWVEMPASMKRAGHLAAVHEGGAGKRVLLLGHLDTVFESSPATRNAPARRCRRRAPRWWRWRSGPTSRSRSKAARATMAWTPPAFRAVRRAAGCCA